MNRREEGAYRDEEDPCPECGCPFLSERTQRTTGPLVAWRDENDGEWYCGPRDELVVVRCLSRTCGWESRVRFRYGKLHQVLSEGVSPLPMTNDGPGYTELRTTA